MQRWNTVMFPVIVVCISLCWSTMLYGQVTTAQVLGTIEDSQGLVIPQAKVVAENQLTGQNFETQSNELGLYLLRALPVGTYSVAVEAPGFKQFLREGISLSAGQDVRLDVRMEVGAVSESVTVEAVVSPVNVTSNTLDLAVDSKRVLDLPMGGRNLLTLANLSPGVTRSTTGIGPANQQAVNVNGNRISATNVLLDGGPMYQGHRGAAMFQPPPDTIQEMKVVTSGIDSEYSRGAAVISVITKSGTNEFHGSLWDYFRNDKLDARSFFASTVPKLRYNQFGGTIGGPVVKNKAFFFASYQGMEIRSDRVQSSAFPPTAEERAGDFSASRGAAPVDPDTGQPFPGARIPSSRFDPVALKLLDMFPLPNRSNGQYVTQIAAASNTKTYLVKGDYDFSPGDRTTFRYFHHHPSEDDPFSASNIDGYAPSVRFNRTWQPNISHTHTFSPNLLFTGRFSFSQYELTTENLVRTTLADLGSNYITGGGPGSLPQLGISGRVKAYSAREGSNQSHSYAGIFDWSWFRGKHEIRFGGSFQGTRYYYGNSDRSYGQIDFNGTFTKNPMADFLIGQVSQLWQQQFVDNDVRYLNYGVYVHDRFRVTNRLTLNLGLRWELFQPWRMVAGKMGAALVPGVKTTLFPTAPIGIIYDQEDAYPLQADHLNPGPRVGFAYDVFGNGKTSIRGGYAVAYDPIVGQMSGKNAPPWSADILTNNVGPLTDPQRYIDVPYGKPFDPDNPTFATPIRLEGSYMGQPRIPYIQTINFTVEQEVVGNTLLQASYVANLGRKICVAQEQNPAVYIPGASSTKNTDERRIYAPDFSATRGYTTDATTSYHGLQIVVNKRFSHGHSIQFSYAYAKAIDENGTSDAANNWFSQDPNNRRGSRGLSDYDIRQRAAASWLWDLPFWKEQQSVVGKVLGGWQFSGIATIQDGMPFTVRTGQDASLRGVGWDRPDLLGDPRLPADRPKSELLTRYFDTTQFARNQPGQFGSAGRNILIGPGDVNFDVTLHKNFPLWSESRRLQFRWEAYNLFNRANFSNPANNLSSSTSFGKITGSSSGRIVQLALRLEF